MAQQDTGSEADKERLGSCALENQGESFSNHVEACMLNGSNHNLKRMESPWVVRYGVWSRLQRLEVFRRRWSLGWPAVTCKTGSFPGARCRALR